MDDTLTEKLKSTISYHPHFALLLNLDTEWTQRRGKGIEEPFLDVTARIKRLCAEYVSDLTRNDVTKKPLTGTQAFAQNTNLPSYLYSPLFFVPWGPSDCQAIVLLDDFDAVHHLTSGLVTSIEEVSIGFCPIATSYSNNRTAEHLIDIHSIFDTDAQEGSNQQGSYQPNDTPSTYTIQHHPLLAFTRFKFDALPSLGFNLLFQEALFAALPAAIPGLQETPGFQGSPARGLRNARGQTRVHS